MNLPDEFVQRLKSQLGSAAEDLTQALQSSSPCSLRVHPEKFEGALRLNPVPWTQLGYRLPRRPIFTLDPLFHAGCYYVQEASSMLLEQAVLQLGTSLDNLRVLDLCAAPGGKTTHLLSLLPQSALLVANEVIRSRVEILREHVAKWGSLQTIVTSLDPLQLGQLKSQFDLLVVDAPCSGEGLFRKDPESLSQWTPAQAELCAERQRRILTDVLPALKVGGHLIYSTCTYNPQENEEIVRWLRDTHHLQPMPILLPAEWGFVEFPDDLGLAAYPHRVQGEGFFLSLLCKTEETPALPALTEPSHLPRSTRTQRQKSRPNACAPCSEQTNATGKQRSRNISLNRPELTDWLRCADVGTEIQPLWQGTDLSAMTPAVFEFLSQWSGPLKNSRTGQRIGTLEKHGFQPAHELALSPFLNRVQFFVEDLDWHRAIRYLRREPIQTGLPDGVGLVTFAGQPLGWVKQIGQRSNNWYPQHWRIRMPAPLEASWSLLDELEVTT